MSELQGTTALITGGSSGIGLAVAQRLAAAGAAVHLVARDETRLNEAVEKVGKEGGEATAHSVDLTDDSQVAQLCEGLESVDILIHSAGYIDLGDVADQAIATLDKHYQVNLRAPYLLTQRLLPKLLEVGGQIVFVNSGAGLNAKGGWSQYAASKHGLKALADSLRDEVSGEGVRVLSVYPGRTASPMQQKVREQEGKAYDADDFVQPDDVAQQVVSALSLPRTASVTELVIRPS